MEEWAKEWKQLNPNWTKVQIMFIQSQIKKAEERGFYTKLRTSGCYSRKETKTLVDKAREEVARDIIEWIEGQGTVEYLNHGEPCEVYEVTPCDIEQLKAKYKGVRYEPFPAKI